MKLKILSDLHLEFHSDGGHGLIGRLDFKGADAVVLAGDFCTAARLKEMLDAFCRAAACPVVFVPGNHDYWGSSFADVENDLKGCEAATGNLTVLLNGMAEVGGRRFLGGTMWFPFRQSNAKFEGAILDFAKVRNFRQEVYLHNSGLRGLLERELQEGDIVVTHHMPSEKSVAARYHGSPYNAFFVTPMDGLIIERKPALWVHGHTHDSFDYKIGETRVVCNPYGYHESELNLEFDAAKRVKV